MCGKHKHLFHAGTSTDSAMNSDLHLLSSKGQIRVRAMRSLRKSSRWPTDFPAVQQLLARNFRGTGCLHSGVGLAAEELADARAADEFAGVDDGAAAGKDGLGGAFDADAFKHGIVHAHMMGFRADDFFVIGIEDHQVGVGANGDGAFARIEAKEFCGRGCHELDETIRRKMLAVDSTCIHKA